MLLSACGVGRAADEPAGSVPPIGTMFHNDQPGFFVRTEVDRPDRTYCDGDTLALTARASEDAVLYVLYQEADGATCPIFPNGVQPNNRVPARQAVEIPGKGDCFRGRVTAAFGTETFLVIASRKAMKLRASTSGSSGTRRPGRTIRSSTGSPGCPPECSLRGGAT